MADQDKLRDMLDNLIHDKGEQARVDFHSYVADKMKEVIHGEPDVDANADPKNEE